ncbi:DNA-primase RepB domain-containing protein [Bradyrhizobium sp. 174]|uniref:DNA-primase RepB domain-containing protein n=1 Tax=Bradyrhizobium sp. 174 TaxID=2782645 RepID=UPI001FF6FEED|nr:DNA-primase RepB domain-containing protein [Bradyrhizobium sp. 174]MCK1570788.1 PriCT-2 domain-containing protein [Bradyrhizobium sp. 174]
MHSHNIPGGIRNHPHICRPEVDLDAADRFLECLDPTAINFTFQTIDDDPERDERQLRRVIHSGLDKAAARLLKLNRQGAGVFVCINQTTLCDRRIQENIVRVRAAFVDLDGAPLEPVLGHHLKPQMVVETSPGKFHAYWLIAGLPLDQFFSVQKALAEKFGGDPSVCDLPRVMRLPGFHHRKRQPFLVRVISSNIDTPAYPHTVFERKAPEQHSSGEKAITTDRDVMMTIAALRVIPPTLIWHHRNYIGMATWRACDGAVEGFEAWAAWLKKSGRFSDSHARKQWRKYFRSQPSRLGLGTLVFLADAANPNWRDWLLYGFVEEAAR